MSGAKAIYLILSTNAGVSAVVGDRIFPQVIPQGKELPAISYMKEVASPENSLDGPGSIEIQRYEIKMYSRSYPELETLVNAARSALDFAAGTFNGVILDGCSFITERDAYSEDQSLFGRLQEYQLRICKP